MPASAVAFTRSPSRRLGALLLATSFALACKVTLGTGGTTPGGDQPEGSPQGTVPPATDPKIQGPRMFADVEYLASDALKGRFTISEDLGVAADHIAAQYETMGISPVGGSYRVPFVAPVGSRPGNELTMWVEGPDGNSQQVAGKELVGLGNAAGTPAYAAVASVRALDRTKPGSVRGKVVLAPSPNAAGLADAVKAFASQEPAGLVLVGRDAPPNPETTREAMNALPFPVVWIAADEAKEWMGVELPKRGAPVVKPGSKVSLAAKSEPVPNDSFNVLATIPGSTKPEEIVMLGAHYDHIGTTTTGGVMCRALDGDEVCNGADDNASGTAMVLEVARAFTDANYRPARTLVFAHFAGEELGLLGSKALADEPPAAAPFTNGKIVAMVNLDMVGRLGDDGLAIGGVGSSDEWMPILEAVDNGDMTVVYERAINGRSDHASYYRKKVPVLFFFTGLHDDYHQAGDHSDKINREGMTSIATMVAGVVQTLGDGQAIAFAPPRTDDEGMVMRMPGSKDSSVEKRTEAPPTALSPKVEAKGDQ
ncbi:MAG: M20/M25/M40 family metallo-hydrolase [Deltaproteobacteria bacterium]|nr:M20/M25/M40 family metallo-hydrolase [Deltaproteobacteria bacterium]